MLIAALVGAFAFQKSGYGGDMSSSIVATSRNKDLDSLATRYCLDTMSPLKSFIDGRLRFREVDDIVDEERAKHPTFGLKKEDWSNLSGCEVLMTSAQGLFMDSIGLVLQMIKITFSSIYLHTCSSFLRFSRAFRCNHDSLPFLNAPFIPTT